MRKEILLRIDENVYELLKTKAEQEGCSINTQIVYMICKELLNLDA